MPSLALSSSAKWPAAGRRRPWAWLRSLVLGCLMGFALAIPTSAGEPALTSLKIARSDEGLLLDYVLDFELPKGAEDALNKAVPLYFVAEAEVFRDRWYWRDKRVASASRLWRIVFQPLTLSYRVTFGGLSQTYATRDEALAAMRRGVNWRIAEPGQIEDGGRHYVEFSFRLDTSLLPRPMQIGIGGQPDWALAVERSQRFD
jgi:Domain of unknown function (DUF4390)